MVYHVKYGNNYHKLIVLHVVNLLDVNGHFIVNLIWELLSMDVKINNDFFYTFIFNIYTFFIDNL